MGKKVLVVDDDPDVRLFSVTVLEEHGYTPLEAANGEEGLKMIKEQKPDLIILDVLMQRQSGIRLYRELKTDIFEKYQGYHPLRDSQENVSEVPESADRIWRQGSAGTRNLFRKAGGTR